MERIAEEQKLSREEATIRVLAVILANSVAPGYKELRDVQQVIHPNHLPDQEFREVYQYMIRIANIGGTISTQSLVEMGAPRTAVKAVSVAARTPHSDRAALAAHLELLGRTYLPEVSAQIAADALGSISRGVNPSQVFRDGFERFQKAEGVARGSSRLRIRDMSLDCLSEMSAAWRGEPIELPFVEARLPAMNDLLRGGFPLHETIIAARPGVGKTCFWENELLWQGSRGRGGIVASWEMPAKDHTMRMIMQRARTWSGINEILSEDFPRSSQDKMAEAAEYVSALPVSFLFEARRKDYSLSTLMAELDREIRMWDHDHPPKFLVIDYLQLLRDSKDGVYSQMQRNEEVAHINRTIKDWAEHHKVAALVLAQLNRNITSGGDGKMRRPRISDIKDCGDIEQDAATVVLIHRDPADFPTIKGTGRPDPKGKQRCEIIIDKARRGAPGTIDVLFEGSNIRYDEADGPFDDGSYQGWDGEDEEN